MKYRLLWPVVLILLACSQPVTRPATQSTGNANSTATGTSGKDTLRHGPTHEEVWPLEIPAKIPAEAIIRHSGFSLVYDEQHEQARWVAYELSLEKTNRVAQRTNQFKPDPKVATGTADNSDYTRSGYDRGHLAPAADMSWSHEAMAESFYFSNISPQVPSFNRGVWKRLEELVRQWAIEDTVIYVVTGPVLREGLPAIGANQVSVPEYFYKVVLVYKPVKAQGIGFILANEGSTLALSNFAVTIDSVQRLTGIDFFASLPDEEEARIENDLCVPCWTWPGNR